MFRTSIDTGAYSRINMPARALRWSSSWGLPGGGLGERPLLRLREQIAKGTEICADQSQSAISALGTLRGPERGLGVSLETRQMRSPNHG